LQAKPTAIAFDPMSMAEFAGSGFGFTSDEFEHPFDKQPDEEEYVYSPTSPASPHDYSPTSPRYSPASSRYSPNDRPYSPTSPRYSPASPVYRPASPALYNPNEYDPNMPSITVEPVPVPYDPESVPFWGGDDDNADVGF
jgi:DNA-directed RNA polymerase II subunit RPB1